jgi:hypothetical protein
MGVRATSRSETSRPFSGNSLQESGISSRRSSAANLNNYRRTPHHDDNNDRPTRRALIFKYNNCGHAASMGRAQVDLALTRRVPQSPSAYRSIRLPGKSEWLVLVRTRLKVTPALEPLDPRWPNQIPAVPRSADHWIEPLPMRRPLQDSYPVPVFWAAPRPPTGNPLLPQL